MPWFKVDDNLAFHHKVVAAGNPAMGLWVRAGSACAQQLTDGFVPHHMIATLGTKAQAERLVSAGLWTRVEGGYKFHEWTERQPSKADVEAERAAHAARMRAYRERKKAARRDASSQVSAVRDASRTDHEQGTNNERAPLVQAPRPDPTRPDPTVVPTELPVEKPATRKRARQLPDDWQPNDTHRRIATEERRDIAREATLFRDDAAAKGRTAKDWDAAFRNWLRSPYGLRRDAAPASDQPRLPHASELEPAPSGMTDAESWEWMMRQRKRQA